ncbi:MAG: TspO/MBR family protein [Chloroflexota bacterium]|nr:TspO/MBR family protein [Chloroflexota bacterium]
MAIAVFLVWREGLTQDGVMAAFIIFWVQLVLNVLWSVSSITSQRTKIMTMPPRRDLSPKKTTIIEFFSISAVAGGLLIPYILWVSIASSLNIRVWMLNR